MFRKPAFWIAFAALAIGAAIFSAINFSTAFPLVSLDIRMDREAALSSARDLANRYNWPPMDFDQAVAFSGSPEVQYFIELEGGGKEKLAEVLRQDLFSPYTWEVRHYRESQTHETRIRFTPQGKPYAFSVTLPEQEAGAAIEREAARAIAERTATENWNVDFAPYSLVESPAADRPGGRRDHTFVYERKDAQLGEGRYRLRLVVGGDRLTEFVPFVQVPEAFSRRYEEMRSANDTITIFDSVALFAVYLLGCCGVGLFFLMRHHWVIWRQALKWGLVVCALVALDVFNSWPRLWMNYDTALSASGFALQQIAATLGIFTLMAALLFISFTAAESLSRRAFPHHIQLWKLWSSPTAGSKPVLGQLTAGYLLVSVFFAYEILLYAFGHSRLGWWSPSDTLINPDLFGAHFPFLPAVANSLQAGFWEEALFRAVPLACAALIGEKLGARKSLIVIAMICQALIFGAGHAGYVNQPAYVRILELIIPSLAFGGLYLAFGLLPGIILHYAFDLVWFAMPIFMSSAPRARVEQVLVIVLAFVPLGITLVARARAGRWTEVPGDALNGAWTPPLRTSPPPEAPEPQRTVLSPAVKRWLPLAGLAGLIAWSVLSNFTSDAPKLSVSREQAQEAARAALAERGVMLDPAWKVLTTVPTVPGEPHRFVWRTAGRDVYDKLKGTYLPDPYWLVRFAKFEGDVAARAEEYQVRVGEGPHVFRVLHQLAEGAAGASLSEEDARRIARTAALATAQVPPESFKEISVEPQKRPMRTDWTFQFADERDYGLKEGQARISVAVAGDQVADVNRYVFIPEEWVRNERARRNLPDLMQIGCAVLLVALAAAGVLGAVVQWARKRPFSVRAFLILFAVLFIVGVGNAANGWPTMIYGLPTAQSFTLLVLGLVAVNLVSLFILSISLGLAGGSLMAGAKARSSLSLRQSLVLGVSVGILAAAGAAVGQALLAPEDPQWRGFSGVTAWLPFLGNVLGPLNGLMTTTIVAAILLQHVDKLSSRWRKRRVASVVVLILVGIVSAGTTNIESVASWLISGMITGVFLAAAYVLVLRHAFALLPIAVATITVLSRLAGGFVQAYPAALPGAITGALLTAIAAWIWVRAASPAESHNFGDVDGILK
jgi:hypothetical protein